MSSGPLDDDAVESYREAGGILVETMNEAREMIEPGVTQLEVAEYAEDMIREAGAGLAFPVNISVDEAASHATPAREDDTEFGDEMVCLDIGVHVDGYIADAAVTVDFTDTPDLVEASEQALEAAVDAAGPGVEVGAIGAEIESVIEGYGYTPILNLTGHGVERYDAHTGPNIPNRAVDRSVELEVGQAIAIEPFAPDGRGKVGEGGTEEIYEQVGDGDGAFHQLAQLVALLLHQGGVERVEPDASANPHAHGHQPAERENALRDSEGHLCFQRHGMIPAKSGS
jgi:methionyl aminopeptidase